MSFFSSLFSSDSLIDKASKGIDAAFFTDEEKANHFKELLKLYEPFKVAQRLLALVFSIPYAIAWLITFCASFFVDVSAQIQLLISSDGLAPIVLLINAFYFGGGALEGVVRRVRSKSD